MKADMSLTEYPENAVAVVGMGCKLPGAQSPDEFWDLLHNGKRMAAEVPTARFPLQNHWRSHGMSHMRGNFLEGVELFDHQFFGKSTREAAAMDPQQRLLLEVTYHALETSDYFQPGREHDTNIGCYIGGFSNDYNDNLAGYPTSAFTALGCLKSFQAGRVSHFFGWTGPSIVFDTACSSSAVAIDAACKDILLGNCTGAIAGGVAVITSPYFYQNLAGASFLSPDGTPRPFDAGANGYSRGEGIGVVFLKRLSVAYQESDPILGVICSSAVRQNSNNFRITTPDPLAQQSLYKQALASAQMQPEDINYIEAHAAGTRIGDVSEYNGIKGVFGGTDRDRPLFVSSLKANIGHIEGVSGVVGLIKIILMMQNGKIPLQAKLEQLHPGIEGSQGNIVIPRDTQPWKASPMVACLNNFGASGNITALIVKEPPRNSTEQKQQNGEALDSSYPICICAHSLQSLRHNCKAIRGWVSNSKNAKLGDIAFNISRKANISLRYQWSTTAKTVRGLTNSLQAIDALEDHEALKPKQPQPVILLFSGQTDTTAYIERHIYETCAVFRHHFNECDQALTSLGATSLFPGIFEGEPCHSVAILHTRTFAIQYSCAKTWIDTGLSVARMIGHSIGQLTALCVSGAMSLTEGIKLVLGRARLIESKWSSEKGAMLAVKASYPQVQDILEQCRRVGSHDDLEISCYNGATSYVLSGTEKAIKTAMETLENNRIKHKHIRVTHGFHNKLTDPILEDLVQLSSQLTFSQPKIPVETCSLSKSWEIPTPELIRDHTRGPVYFEAAMQRVVNELGACTWLEAGSGSSISSMAFAAISPELRAENKFLATQLKPSLSAESLSDVTRQLWSGGQNVQFWPFHGVQSREYARLSPPPYSFTKHRHWLEWRESRTTSSEIHRTKEETDSIGAGLVQMTRMDEAAEGSATFAINVQSPEWVLLIDHHAPKETGLCTASLYAEIVTRATGQVRSAETRFRSFGVIQDLVISKPIGRSDGKKLNLTLQATSPTREVWRFSFHFDNEYSHDRNRHGPHICSATGLIRFTDGEGNPMAYLQRAWDFITLDSTWDAIEQQGQHCARNCSVNGDMIYQLLARIVNYGKVYRVINNFWSGPKYAKAYIKLPQDWHQFSSMNIIPPVAIEGVLQVAAAHVNLFGPRTRSVGMFLCTRVKCIQPSRRFSWESFSSGWHVIGRVIKESDTFVEYDIMAFTESTGRLALMVHGVGYSYSSVQSVDNMLKVATSSHDSVSNITFQKPWHGDSAESDPGYVPMSDFVNGSANEHGCKGKKSSWTTLHSILRGFVDIPQEGLSASASLESLGVDSLAMSEIQHLIKEEFGADLPPMQSSDTTAESLLKIINSQFTPEISPPQRPQSRADSLVASRLHGLVEAHLGPLEQIEPLSSLGDLGVDSLLSQELIGDIEKEFGCQIDVEIRPETTFTELCAAIPSGTTSNVDHLKDSLDSSVVDQIPGGPTQDIDVPPQTVFLDTQKRFPELAAQTSWLHFWQRVYPKQCQLVLSYVVDAFSCLGCDLRATQPGCPIPPIDVAPQHAKLKSALHEILRHEGIIDYTGEGDYIRSDKGISTQSSFILHEEITQKHPQHCSEHDVLRITGPELAGFLSGTIDPLKQIFGIPRNRQLLEDFYSKAPMFRTMNLMLCDFLDQLAIRRKRTDPIHILELGAGTGGTTTSVLETLVHRDIPFKYYFTDISSSFVRAARRKFAAYADSMVFLVLDIEQEPAAELVNCFDIILSTNCIHGTRDLVASLTHARQMLRHNGLICLIEITKRLFWLDLVFGLLHGWWLFEDGRTHPLASSALWEKSMLAAGFEQVLTSDGPSLESQTVGLVCGFTSKCDSVESHPRDQEIDSETIVFKTGKPHLYADIYYPSEFQRDPEYKYPIALLIHGGGHVMLSRKNIRLDQVHRLLDHGIIPVSIDYRLCPEVNITDGPLCDVRDALKWARNRLPHLQLKHSGIALDGDRVGVIGWSSGGTLALLLGQTADTLEARPPEAIITFYCPTDYEDEFWKTPQASQPQLQIDDNDPSILEGIKNSPVTGFDPNQAESVQAQMSPASQRSRIYAHMVQHGQTLQVLSNGLPPANAVPSDQIQSILLQQDPPVDRVRQFSPYAYAAANRYRSPTYLLHGKNDELVPWQQAEKMQEALREHGIPCDLSLVEDAMHLFDINAGRSGGMLGRSIAEAYGFLAAYLHADDSGEEVV